jgi:hypothetical protein
MANNDREAVNLAAGLEAAAVGIPIFPMKIFKRGDRWIKKPAIKGWRTAATTDPTTIEAWAKADPQIVFAIELEKAGLVVIDCDRHREDADGCVAFQKLVDANGIDLPWVPVTRTAGGGWHFFFRQPKVPIGCPVKTGLPAGIDVKGAGGSVVVPGSMRPDGDGWWQPLADNGRPTLPHAYRNGLAVIPSWLEKRARKVEPPEPRPQPRPRRKPSRSNSGNHRGQAYARAALDRQCQKIGGMLADTGRNNALNAAAFSLGRMVARPPFAGRKIDASPSLTSNQSLPSASTMFGLCVMRMVLVPGFGVVPSIL